MKDGFLCQVDDGVRSLEGWKFPPQHAFAFHGIPKIRGSVLVLQFLCWGVTVLLIFFNPVLPVLLVFCLLFPKLKLLFSAYITTYYDFVTVIFFQTSIKIFRFSGYSGYSI